MGARLGTGEVLQPKMPRFAQLSDLRREVNSINEISCAPWVEFGGTGSGTIHLAHANGFPTASYRQLAAHLSPDFKVIGMNARPMWPGSHPSDLKSWQLAAVDIIRFLEWRGTGPVIGMGHSFGGICTLLAANMRPDLFTAVVLIEPVVLPRWVYLMGDVFPKFGVMDTFDAPLGWVPSNGQN
jgi:pimeloyl-ACP methyl ester carboxylesterase